MENSISQISAVFDTYSQPNQQILDSTGTVRKFLADFALLIQNYTKQKTGLKSLSFSIKEKNNLYVIAFNNDEFISNILASECILPALKKIFEIHFKDKITISLASDGKSLYGTTVC